LAGAPRPTTPRWPTAAPPGSGSGSAGTTVRTATTRPPYWPQAPAATPCTSPGFSHGRCTGADFATVAYRAATGAPLWTRRYSGPGNGFDRAFAVAVSPDGRTVYVTGNSAGKGTGRDFATVAYRAATGARLWLKRYGGPGRGFDGARSVAVSPGGRRVFVTGASAGPASSQDFATIAYRG
jgi:hypothetical protein